MGNVLTWAHHDRDHGGNFCTASPRKDGQGIKTIPRAPDWEDRWRGVRQGAGAWRYCYCHRTPAATTWTSTVRMVTGDLIAAAVGRWPAATAPTFVLSHFGLCSTRVGALLLATSHFCEVADMFSGSPWAYKERGDMDGECFLTSYGLLWRSLSINEIKQENKKVPPFLWLKREAGVVGVDRGILTH